MKEFRKYFSGLERDFGFCNVNNGYHDPQTNKLKFDPGDYGWSKRNISDQDYQDHLDGKRAIGIQACDDKGMASFGAIDIDPSDYSSFDIHHYLKVIQDKDLPVIPIKSKSNGLHIYVFTAEKVPATLIREFLQNLLFLFGLSSKTEIFPKQTQLGMNQDNVRTSGSFINLPYFKKTERKALLPDGTELEFEDFINVVKDNLQTQESLKEVSNKKVKEILTGGPEDLLDGPPCLQMICKQVQESGNKLKDERDRFLFNYMVFAKKKFKDEWGKKVLNAARDFIKYDEVWGDDKVNQKIKSWSKDTAGHTCHDIPISSYCAKGTCLRRKYGIGSHRESSWPQISGLIKICYRPDPEYFFNVELSDSKVVQIHAKHIKKISEMKEMRALIADQTSIFPPIIKNNEYQPILDALWATKEDIKPPAGTNPIEMLKKYLEDYVNGPEATTYASFKSGAVLKDEEHYYFDYDKFYEEIKRNEWTKDRPRTATLIKSHFKAEFGFQKRFPKGESEKSFPPVRCIKMPADDLMKEEIPDEKIEIEDKQNIV